MRSIATILLAILGTAFLVAIAGGKADQYQWDPSLKVTADLDKSGVADSAQLGIAENSVGLLIKIDSKRLPIIEIPIDASKQFGICPGASPTISVSAQSEAPFNALGETPQGYEICTACVEIVVSGGGCDPLQFYWDTMANQIAWWRA